MKVIEISDCETVSGGIAPFGNGAYGVLSAAYFSRGAYGIESTIDHADISAHVHDAMVDLFVAEGLGP